MSKPPRIEDEAHRELNRYIGEAALAFNLGDYQRAHHHAEHVVKLLLLHGLWNPKA